MTNFQTIISLDIQNAVSVNLENWLLKTDYITSKFTIDYIRSLLKNEENQIQKVYIFNNLVFATSLKDDSQIVDFTANLKEELLNFIIPIKLYEIEIYRSVLIDWIFNFHRTKIKTATELRAFQKHESEDGTMFPHFTKNVTSISVEGLGFVLKDFLAPMDDRFKAILQEFKNHYITDKYLTKIKLTRIFIIDEYILGYSFRMENEPEEHFFWNYYFEEHLQMIQPFTFDQDISVTLDDDLDEISKVGIENLSHHDRNKLNTNIL